MVEAVAVVVLVLTEELVELVFLDKETLVEPQL
jgi:hypothetical protein